MTIRKYITLEDSNGAVEGQTSDCILQIEVEFSPIGHEREDISIGLGGCIFATHSNECRGIDPTLTSLGTC